MAEKKNVPEIRFKGFSEEWEILKLNEVSEIIGGGTPSTIVSEYWDGDIDWYSPTEIGDETYAIGSQKKITKLGLEKSSARILPANRTVLFTSRAGIGDMAILKKDGATNQGFQSLVIKGDNNPYFFFSIGHLIKKYALKNASGSTFLEISGKQLGNMDISAPIPVEQSRIGTYFQNLDKLITLHQRKYDKLVILKRAMLEKMFPKNGADVPEIRFKGFEGKWEERKLGDFAKFRRGSFPQPYGNKEWYDGDGAMPFVQVVDVAHNLSLVDNTKQKISLLAQPKSVFVKKGTVVVTLQGSIGRVAILQYDAYVDRTLLIFEDYESRTDIQFWAYLIQQKFEIEEKIAPGGTIKTITKEALSGFQIIMPEYEEQKKIGHYLENLDKFITLHQKELEKLKNIKKACLEKMFV
ncbi:MAG: restriction endonuclease subunit S [Lentimicrobium sp.]|jgi:type I restriction enzyme S subunit|nr:restriction endonuclease subunit S [Lentimicrobium sp.]